VKPDETTGPTGITFWVNGIVAARNGLPYVQLANDKGMIGQFTVAEARSIAFDIIHTAANAEADAMLFKFFKEHDFPEEAFSGLMMAFRDFRHQLDMEKVDKRQSDPDTGEQIP
jgi:hypothetical protein